MLSYILNSFLNYPIPSYTTSKEFKTNRYRELAWLSKTLMTHASGEALVIVFVTTVNIGDSVGIPKQGPTGMSDGTSTSRRMVTCLLTLVQKSFSALKAPSTLDQSFWLYPSSGVA